ncbi:cobyrinate a,c-diamide synthase [Pedococcus sp. NPDC057267]|uniref:cobyrinate a,c-diamide synthase n=1 Tax=Pedococcus sp. NPDC057267 TaxID=3346077 RepID=UPI003641860C
MRVPRLVVAAPASGQGKTTVAVGIMAALTRQGYAVAPAKAGPDYIDPGYHALATGRPGRNLDPWLTSPELVVPLLLHGFQSPAPADIAVVEGVMGLFDGQLGRAGFASTAHVATLTSSPVLLVVDISSASRTVAATVHGLRTFDPGVDVVGVVLNKAGSPRHAVEVRQAVEATGLPVLGVLPRDAGVTAPSRHLGLVPAAERQEAAAGLERLAEQTAARLDLDAILELARRAPDLPGVAWSPAAALHGAGEPSRLPQPSQAGPRPVVAVAGGRAFTFRYAETDELLRAAGCEPVVFDPATDASLPPGTSGLYLGGGFPEVHAAALCANTRLLGEVRDAIAAGLPTVAECAGLLYLSQALDDRPMVGAVPATAAMHPRLTLRYTVARLPVDGLLGPSGTEVNAHEFHHTATSPHAGPVAAWTVDGTAQGFALDPARTGQPTLHASYLHVHWAGNPALAGSFAEAVHTCAATPSAGTAPSAATAPTGAAAGATPSAHVESCDEARAGAAHPTYDLDHHGDAELRDAPELVDLAVNVRVSSPPTWLSDTIRGTTSRLAAYPDVAAARAAVARRHGVPEEMVLLTNGGAEAFTLLARAVEGRHPLVVHPQFTEPEAALRRAGREPDRLVLRAESGFSLDPALVDPRADLVLVGNPTNPTGVVHPRATLEALRTSGRVLVVDEAFADAIPGERESLMGPDLHGVLLLRSLTKTWGVAGLRAGYVVGDPDLVASMRDQQPAWPVSTPAAAVMTATSTPRALAEAARAAEEAGRHRTHLVRALEAAGLRPVPGEAPFVLLPVGPGVREALRAKGFAVRRGDTFPGLDAGWIRIAVRDPATSDAFVEALTHVVGRIGRGTSAAVRLPSPLPSGVVSSPAPSEVTA